MTDYDVIVVGASVAGSTAAMLYAKAGAKVALLERHRDPAAYKVLCSHSIQACGVPVLAELGVLGELEEAGAVSTATQSWHTPWGWITPRPEAGGELPGGYNIRRSTLDPLLRAAAARTPGVDLMLGTTVTELLREGDRVVGVRATGADAGELRARLVVGTDGKNSSVAKLAGLEPKTKPNARFSYFAYYRGLELAEPGISYLYLGQDMAYILPNDDGVTLVACAPHARRLPEFRADLESAYSAYVKALPKAPDLSRGERISKIIGTADYPLFQRQATAPGLALAGDAALATDPIWGVGVGWALETAKWLVDATATAVVTGAGVDQALDAYRKVRRARLGMQQHLIADYAKGRNFNFFERQMFAAGALDPAMARHIHEYASRVMPVREFLAPKVLVKAMVTNARNRGRGTAAPAAEAVAAAPKLERTR